MKLITNVKINSCIIHTAEVITYRPWSSILVTTTLSCPKDISVYKQEVSLLGILLSP